MRLLQKLFIKYQQLRINFISLLSKRKAAETAFHLFTSPQKRQTKPLSPLFQQAEKLSMIFEGNIVKGYRWNFPSDKRLLILHGYESGIVNFEQYIEPLTNKGYEIIGFDAPAHGNSGGNNLDVLIYKEFIIKTITVYGPITSFLTHSFGGLALSLAIETIPHNDSYKIVFIAPATETKTAVDHYFNFLKLDTRLRHEFDKMILEMDGHETSWYSVARAAANIKAQVLFLQDEDDDMTPVSDVLPIINKGYPNFKFIITRGLGHRKIYREQSSVDSVIEFL